MKVRRVVELLYQTYDPEQEIMAVWIGSEAFETKAGVWQRAVELFDNDKYVDVQFVNAVADLVGDADAEIEQEESEKLHANLAMDAYLERVREEQANV
jgi:tellurite resistance protein